jgi:hypothetical protein
MEPNDWLNFARRQVLSLTQSAVGPLRGSVETPLGSRRRRGHIRFVIRVESVRFHVTSLSIKYGRRR